MFSFARQKEHSDTGNKSLCHNEIYAKTLVKNEKKKKTNKLHSKREFGMKFLNPEKSLAMKVLL